MDLSHLDRIHIRDLLIRSIIGVTDEEQRERQDVNLNITLFADLSRACASDDLAHTVDYKAVKKRVLVLVQEGRFRLVERLADAVARSCLQSDGVQAVSVTLDKPGALRFARSVAVEITRSREILE